MSHARQQIRDRVVTNITGLTTTGSRVFRSRVYPLETTDLPALLVYTKSETSERASFKQDDELKRNLELVIEAVVEVATNLDNSLDTIAAEVEAALAADSTCNGLAKDLFLESSEVVYEPERQLALGSIRMTFNVEYITTATTPTTAL